jgi:Acyl-CoA carboxylase epsilon subunit
LPAAPSEARAAVSDACGANPGAQALPAAPSEARAAVSERPALRVVRGEPTAEELAVLTALVAAAGSGGDAPGRVLERRGGWNDPAAQLRRVHRPGPNAWRASAR